MSHCFKMGRLKYNCIWLTLMISVILGGMCVEKVYADSSLCMENYVALERFVDLQEYDVVQEDLYQADFFAQQNDITPIRNNRREHFKTYLRILMSMMLVSFLPQVLLMSSEIMERGQFLNNCSHDFIIYFIHQKDGEKDC